MTSESSPLLQNDDLNSTPPQQQSSRQHRNSFLTGNHLLPGPNALLNADEESLLNQVWEDENEPHYKRTTTTLTQEMKSLTKSSFPVMITSLLQNSLYLASISSVGHIGKEQLAGVTLGGMTANVTGFAFILGLSTCLDTLCSQAHGAGKYPLVGLHFIRCSMFALFSFIPIGILWVFYSEALLSCFIQQHEIVIIASNYLKIVCCGMPGFILFECGKRYIQCQGVFHAGTYVLLVCAPLNAYMNYLFVWNLGIGYKGAAMAVAINYWLMPLGLLTFILYNKQYLKCWPSGLSISDVFQNWDTMIGLALPGVTMVMAEFIGFEVITITASQLGTTQLAAQSILGSISAVAFQIPFSVSISTSTRVANFIGASLPYHGKKAATASLYLGVIIGLINSFITVVFGRNIVRFYTNDNDVSEVVVKVLPVMGAVALVDALNETSAGGMKGQGLQRIGGRITFFSFYALGLPCSFLFCLKFGLGISGLWWGIFVSLTAISLLQTYTVFFWSDWDELVKEAKKRNEAH